MGFFAAWDAVARVGLNTFLRGSAAFSLMFHLCVPK
jgi:hypothetical protein